MIHHSGGSLLSVSVYHNVCKSLVFVGTGNSPEELRELQVEGTTFNPSNGGITGLSSIDQNLEASWPYNASRCIKRNLHPGVYYAFLPKMHAVIYV